MELLAVLALVAIVAVVVAMPLRAGAVVELEETESAEHAELSAARDAKYREIRDAELDYRTGKLSEADWKGQDRVLRADAMELLRRLDASEGREAG